MILLGNPARSSGEGVLQAAFQKKGWDVEVWDNKASVWWTGKRNWWKLGLLGKNLYNFVRSVQCIATLRTKKIDILFLTKAENIHSYSIKRILHSTGAKLVIWNPDNPFKDDMTSMNILRNFKRTDIYYIWGKFLIEPLHAAGCRRVEYLPFGFDPELHADDASLSREDFGRFAADVTFVGTWDVEREKAIEPLADFNLAIWGPRWLENLPDHSPLKKRVRGDGLYGKELTLAYKGSPVVFNHLRNHNGNAHNVRTMEICGIGGGVQLVRRTPEIAKELFVEDEHLLCYSSVEEMKQQMHWALAHPEDIKKMALRARERVYERHLISHRVAQMLKDFTSLG